MPKELFQVDEAESRKMDDLETATKITDTETDTGNSFYAIANRTQFIRTVMEWCKLALSSKAEEKLHKLKVTFKSPKPCGGNFEGTFLKS